VILAVLLGLGVVAQWRLQIGFQREWYKALALVEQFRANELIRDHTTFEIVDQTDAFVAAEFLGLGAAARLAEREGDAGVSALHRGDERLSPSPEPDNRRVQHRVSLANRSMHLPTSALNRCQRANNVLG